MTTTEQIDPRPRLAVPPRPPRPLSSWQLMKAVQTNSLAAWDEELFDALFVERRFIWGRFFVISDPDGIQRVLQDNYDNYPRLAGIRRVFEFASGTGMLCAEGDTWRRHRRLINPTLDPRAVAADAPLFVEMAGEMARHLAQWPADRELDLGQSFTHLITASTRRAFTTDDQEIEP